MKKTRQRKILEIIRKNDVETQEDLASLLQEEGITVTQATVSRDIRELKLFKAPADDGGQKYAALEQDGENEKPMEHRYIRVLHDAFLSVEAAQNILVVKRCRGWLWRRQRLWMKWSLGKLWVVLPETIRFLQP